MSQALLASVNRLAAQIANIQAEMKAAEEYRKQAELRLLALENQQRKTLGLPKKLGIQPVAELKMSHPAYEK